MGWWFSAMRQGGRSCHKTILRGSQPYPTSTGDSEGHFAIGRGLGRPGFCCRRRGGGLRGSFRLAIVLGSCREGGRAARRKRGARLDRRDKCRPRREYFPKKE